MCCRCSCSADIGSPRRATRRGRGILRVRRRAGFAALHPATVPALHEGNETERRDRDGARLRQSIGSTLTIEAPWLLPTQKVTGLVELSTNTRRILVVFGNRYSTNSPVLGSSRDTRSLSIEPVQASPFLSVTTS